MERWETKTIICDGGLDIVTSILEQGTLMPGAARSLINYEPAESRGYRKVLGYTKFDDDVVPGETDSPVLGVHPCSNAVFAVRKSTDSTPSYDVYRSETSGWTKLNTVTRENVVTKARFIGYNLTEQVNILTDGANPALKIAPSGITEIDHVDAPVDPSFAVEHLSRLILSGYSSNPAAISLSAPNNDEDFSAGAGAIEFVVGDIVRGLASFREVLYIFCTSSIHKLVGNTSDTFAILPVTTQIGCIDGDTIQEVGGDLIYLAPDGLRSLAATERIGDVELGLQSLQIQPRILQALADQPTVYSSIVIPSKSQYRIFPYIADVDPTSQTAFLGKFNPTEDNRQYQWSTLVGFPVYSAGSLCRASGTSVVVIGHPTNGFVYRLESSGGFDGQPIPFEIKSPPITFDDINILKVLYKINILGESEVTTNFQVRMILDEYEAAQVSLQPTAQSVTLTGVGAVFGSAIFDVDVFADLSIPRIDRLNIEGSCTTVTVTITGSDTKLPHRIDGYIITYASKSRKVGD